MIFKKLDHTKPEDLNQLKVFLSSLNEGASSFRYYKNRPLTIISRHHVTILGFEHNVPMAYGHIETENNTNWLGVAVSDNSVGKGAGTKMMNELLEFCREQKINPIHLTVDHDNVSAIRLYEKFDFILETEHDSHYKFRLDLS